MQLGVLLLQQLQLWQHLHAIDVLRRDNAVAHHALKPRLFRVRRLAEPLPGPGAGEPDHSGNLAGDELLRRLVFGAGVEAQLRQLLLPLGAGEVAIAQRPAHRKLAAEELEKRQAAALRVACDLENAGGKALAAIPQRRERVKRPEQLLHAAQLQARAEKAGEQRPPRDKRGELRVRHVAAREDLVHHRLVKQRDLFEKRLVAFGKIHAAGVEPLL